MSDADSAPEEPQDSGDSRADRKAAKRAAKAEKRALAEQDNKKAGLMARIALFFRQVVAELKKVIWPNKRELVNYTWVVLVFVVLMGAFIWVLDFVFGKGVLAIFG